MKQVIIVDGNNLYTRGHFIAKNQGKNSFNFCLEMYFNLQERYKDARFVFAFDTCKSKRRLDFYPEYKANRAAKSSMTPEEYVAFKQGLNDFIEVIRNSGMIVMEGHDYEADDYIACAAKMLQIKYDAIIVSTDKDLLQLIGPRIRVYDPIKGIVVTEDNFVQVMEIPLKYFVDYKCMLGDSSDNIGGLVGIGEKTAKKFINAYGGFHAIKAEFEKMTKQSVREKTIIDGEMTFDRNIILMDLEREVNDRALQMIVRKQAGEVKIEKEKVMRLLCKYESSENYKKLIKEKGI